MLLTIELPVSWTEDAERGWVNEPDCKREWVAPESPLTEGEARALLHRRIREVGLADGHCPSGDIETGVEPRLERSVRMSDVDYARFVRRSIGRSQYLITYGGPRFIGNDPSLYMDQHGMTEGESTWSGNVGVTGRTKVTTQWATPTMR